MAAQGAANPTNGHTANGHVQLPVYRPQIEADQEIRRLEQDNGWLRYRVERLEAGLSNASRELGEALRRAEKAETELEAGLNNAAHELREMEQRAKTAEDELAKRLLKEAS